jgi:uncharacterized protein YdaT
MAKNLHVVPHGRKWAVRPAGSKQHTSSHRTQKATIDRARHAAKVDKSEVVVHSRDGRIRDKDSYGNDLCPPRDKRH